MSYSVLYKLKTPTYLKPFINIRKIFFYTIILLISFYVTIYLDFTSILFFTILFIFIDYKGYQSKITNYLVNLEPKFYGISYLLLIPIYAIIYDNLAMNSFYHATFQYEDDSVEEQVKDDLSRNVGNDLKSYLWKKYETDSIFINELNIFTQKIGVSAINRITNDEVFFDLSIPFYEEHDNCSTHCNKSIIYHMRLNFDGKRDFDQVLSLDSISLWKGEYDQIRDSKIAKDIGKLFYQKDIANFDFYQNSTETFRTIRIITDARQGKVSISRNYFDRMFYLSAITITTTGFGDIVPLTKEARLLVTSESIIGIILIGLFLNSLSNKMIKRNSDF